MTPINILHSGGKTGFSSQPHYCNWPTIQQPGLPSLSQMVSLCWITSGHVKILKLCTYVALPNQLSVSVANSRLWITQLTSVQWQTFTADYYHFTVLKIMCSTRWEKAQRLQQSQNELYNNCKYNRYNDHYKTLGLWL